MTTNIEPLVRGLFTLFTLAASAGVVRWVWLARKGRTGSRRQVALNGAFIAVAGVGLIVLYGWLFVG